ncbi:hypothetical protein [Roseovarius tolerans]|uniref:hypothetical protein n=1 Tax=Roseovarius tolerans TaxID=74031 RepID=UPI001587F627|nr:hypothetical protein [Roseovarius tolerans]
MNTSPTLLDFGIYRLEKRLERELDRFVPVSYSWDEDEISITLISFDSEGYSEPVCRALIEKLRRSAGYRDGQLLDFYEGTSSFTAPFTHEGFVKGDAEENNKRLKELSKKFTIYCFAESKRFSAKLAGTLISITELD